MYDLEDIIPESLVPASHKSTYRSLQQMLSNPGSIGTERVKNALAEDMADILNAISWDKLKQEKLTQFKKMLSNIKETKQSTNRKSSSHIDTSSESGGGRAYGYNNSGE